MEQVIFDIAGMRCGACAVGIELALVKKERHQKYESLLERNGSRRV